MTQDQIILMADASSISLYGMGKDRAKFIHYLEAFAKLVAERALADSMQEVQRLGQEIEQEPDWKDGIMEQQEETILWQAKRIAELIDTLPQRTEPLIGCVNHDCDKCKPLSFNEITAIEEKVYMRTTHKGKPAFEYANALIRATEAAHGIKENT